MCASFSAWCTCGVFGPAVPNTEGAGKCLNDADCAFSGVVSSFYWSSSTVAVTTTTAWDVGMANGRVNDVGKTNTRYVWPVRGGQ